MKTRSTFCCLAAVALVLSVAASPLNATERRDQVLSPEQIVAAASVRTTESPKPIHRTRRARKTPHVATHSQAKTPAVDPKRDGRVGPSCTGK